MAGALNMAAAVGEYVQLTDQNLEAINIDPATAICRYEVRAGGSVFEELTPEGNARLEYWLNPPAGAPGGYSVRATVTAGVLSGGSSSTGVWLDFATNRGWQVSDSGGVTTATIDVDLSLDGGATILVTATITLRAESLP